MGRSPEADFHHGQNLLPVSGHTFTGMPFACLILVRLQARCVARRIARIAAKAVLHKTALRYA
jgi:hypothetical protein